MMMAEDRSRYSQRHRANDDFCYSGPAESRLFDKASFAVFMIGYLTVNLVLPLAACS
jgi:hypothetical protein